MANVKRPIKFKLDSYRFYRYDKMSPIDAFAEAGRVNDVTLSGCMTTKAYASGYMSDDIKNFLRKQIQAGNSEVVQYFAQWHMALDF